MKRFMYRNTGGVSLTPGSNIVEALGALCDYEDLCEDAGCSNAQELRNLIGNVIQQLDGRTLRGWRSKAPEVPVDLRAKKPLPPSPAGKVKHCEDCVHYIQTGPRNGYCDKHPKKIRQSGSYWGSLIEVPGEYRAVVARRVACSDHEQPTDEKIFICVGGKWEPHPPEWGGPSAELLQEDT